MLNGNLQQSGYKRIVVKAGTSLLTGGGDHLDLTIMAALVEQVAHLQEAGHEMLLVTSGAIASGWHSLRRLLAEGHGGTSPNKANNPGTEALSSLQERRGVPFRQVLAAVGQSHLMHTYQELFSLHRLVVAQALLTRRDIAERQGYLHVRDALLELLNLAVVPIINENDVVAVEEIGDNVFGDNDTLSSLVSNLVDADLLVMLTDTEGLYTADPAIDPQAQIIPQVEQVDEAIMNLVATEKLHPMSRGGMAMKLEAARLATSWGVTVVIAKGTTPDILRDVVAGQPRGTIFLPRASKMESRRRWLLSGLWTRGEILVDKGAVSALRSDHRSLLPAGIREVRGDFNRHDVVLIIDGEGQRVACGVANYSSVEAGLIKGLRSDRIQEALGHHYGDEVVHRNNLALL